jgi:hypothetical protein
LCFDRVLLARYRLQLLRTGSILVAVLLGAAPAHAAPVRGTGKAAASEWKQGGTPEKVRARALRRARQGALERAIAAIGGPVDRAAKQQLQKHGDGWTGAYRILSEDVKGGSVHVEVEVEIDTAGLAKRLTPRVESSSAPLYRVGEIDAGQVCGDAADNLASALESSKVVARDAKATELRFAVTCRLLGAVPNTFLHAAHVQVKAGSGKRPVVEVGAAGFGCDDDAAVAHALERALDDAAADLGRHRRGQVEVRVEAPHPAARIRRLQRAIRDAVMGVSGSAVAGIDPDGAVRLRVTGNLRADELAAALRTLSLPDFSLTIVGVDGPDALTIRLR